MYVGSGVKSYGRLVILKHKNDYLSAYAHNDLIFIKEGQRVSRGQLIAAAGDSGADRVMLHLGNPQNRQTLQTPSKFSPHANFFRRPSSAESAIERREKVDNLGDVPYNRHWKDLFLREIVLQ